MKGRIASSAMLALGVAACAGVTSVPFAEADFAPFAGEGMATVEGQAFLKTRGGDIKTCAGEIVYLAPGTSYDEAVLGTFGFGLSGANAWAGPAFPHWRRSICDAGGKFTFRAVPAGAWFAITQVNWEVAAPTLGNLSATDNQGGILVQKVFLRAGPNDVVMSAADAKTPFGL